MRDSVPTIHAIDCFCKESINECLGITSDYEDIVTTFVKYYTTCYRVFFPKYFVKHGHLTAVAKSRNPKANQFTSSNCQQRTFSILVCLSSDAVSEVFNQCCAKSTIVFQHSIHEVFYRHSANLILSVMRNYDWQIGNWINLF